MSVHRSQLVPWTKWRHVATDSYYVLIGISLCSTNGPNEHKEECVVYFSLTHQHLCHREISEFCDGRFEPTPLEMK